MPWEDCFPILLDRAVRRVGLDKLVADLSLANRQLIRGRNPAAAVGRLDAFYRRRVRRSGRSRSFGHGSRELLR